MAKAPIASGPSQRALDNPSLRENSKSYRNGSAANDCEPPKPYTSDKPCWNPWTVIRLILPAKARRTSLVSDQGILQAVWSVGLSAGRDVDDWWDFLAHHEMLPDILIVVHCSLETAATRLNQRRVGTSRLTGIGAEDARWARASELMAGLINEARQRFPVIELQNDGTRPIEALAADVSRQMAEHLEAAPHAD